MWFFSINDNNNDNNIYLFLSFKELVPPTYSLFLKVWLKRVDEDNKGVFILKKKDLGENRGIVFNYKKCFHVEEGQLSPCGPQELELGLMGEGH